MLMLSIIARWLFAVRPSNLCIEEDDVSLKLSKKSLPEKPKKAEVHLKGRHLAVLFKIAQ